MRLASEARTSTGSLEFQGEGKLADGQPKPSGAMPALEARDAVSPLLQPLTDFAADEGFAQKRRCVGKSCPSTHQDVASEV